MYYHERDIKKCDHQVGVLPYRNSVPTHNNLTQEVVNFQLLPLNFMHMYVSSKHAEFHQNFQNRLAKYQKELMTFRNCLIPCSSNRKPLKVHIEKSSYFYPYYSLLNYCTIISGDDVYRSIQIQSVIRKVRQ